MVNLFFSVRSMRIRKKKKIDFQVTKEEMKTGKNEVNVMSVNITIVSLFCTDSAIT